MSLPFEIIETIIDTLDIQSVRSCARVCHAFLPLSRKHIFASISLNDTESQAPSPTTCMFERLLSTTPDVAVHIRSLSYCIDAEDFNNGSFHDALKKITRLQSLSIWYYSKFKFDWKRNPLRPALLHLLHLPTLAHLKLFHLENFVISDLIPCTGLKELELDFITAAYAEKKTLLDKLVCLSKFSAGVRSTTVTTRCAAHCAQTESQSLTLLVSQKYLLNTYNPNVSQHHGKCSGIVGSLPAYTSAVRVFLAFATSS